MATYTVEEGGAYSTLNAALSAATSGTDIINITGTWTSADTTVCTTGAAVTINCVGGSENPGYTPASPTHYRLQNTSGISITTSYDLTINNIDIGNQSTGDSDECIRIRTGETGKDAIG